MNCFGKNASTGLPVEIELGATIVGVAQSPGFANLYLAPGFIDIQVNGFAGVDYNDPSAPHEEIARSINVLFSTGVTRFYPTVVTGSPEDMRGALRNLARAREALPAGDAMDGFHVEGPHISPEDGSRGAHPRRWVRKPDFEEFLRWQDAAGGRVRLVTVAPEWPEAPGYVQKLVERGVAVSIGHTQATGEQIAAAASAGATLSTHLGNGAPMLLPRHPNFIWHQLAEDRLMAGFIGDGIHLDASFLKAAIRAKGLDRSVLVTDASAPAGATPGRYQLGEQPVELTPDNRVVLLGTDKLAGSALRMDRGVENLMRLAGLSLADAVRMATTNSARASRVPGRAQGLVPGERGDLIQFRFDPSARRIEVVGTWLSGRKVF